MVIEAPVRPSLPREFMPDGCREATLEDWWAIPGEDQQYELFNGVFVLVASPDAFHQDIAGEIFVAFKLLARRHGAYAAHAPFGVALPNGQGFEPDVLYVRAGRREVRTRRGIEGVPDVVVEVLSPATRRFDRLSKLPAYLEAGVPEVWLVDPEARTVEVHSASGAETVRFGETIPSAVVEVGDAGLGAVGEFEATS